MLVDFPDNSSTISHFSKCPGARVIDFVIGQRWINDAELQLGLGTVLEVEHRTVTIVFQATGEKRTYAIQTSPLTRITFSTGDTIRCYNGLQITIDSVRQTEGLLSYSGRDEKGDSHEVDEILLDDYIQLSRPSERLFSGQIDSDKWFALRFHSLRELNRQSHSALRGLTGCRVSLIPHQLYIAHEVAHRYAPRVLLADEVGLGKTIEAGLILHQQLLTERARRILIVVPENLVHQWLVELLRRFNMQFSIFDEERYQAILEFDNEQNPFHSEQLVLCNLNFLSQHETVLRDALVGDWDLLVVDEAHHLQWTPQDASIEYKVIEQLSSVTSGILLLTATPEQLGRTGHFARLRLLDPDRFPDFDSFIEEEKHYEPIANAIELLFREESIEPKTLEILSGTLEISDEQGLLSTLNSNDKSEVDLANLKSDLIERLLDRHGTGRVLFRNTRATVSGFPERKLSAYPLPLPSIYSGLSISNIETDILLTPERIYDSESTTTSGHWSMTDPRVSWLHKTLSELKPSKVLIIAADTKTVVELAEALRVQAGFHVAVFHQEMSIIERDRAAAYFADEEEGCQALVCSEIGSEGRNFQFAHHMVLFDLPLNPDLLEQRIGRLDRIGQKQTIRIHVPYLENSAQATMFRWLHEGLNAFERSCPVGSIMFDKLQSRLFSALENPGVDIEDIVIDTQLGMLELENALQKGRDRLLEFNSCRPAIADALRQDALSEDRLSTLAQYMDSIFDCFGVHTEEHSTDRYIISPGAHMLTAFPLLQDDGMTVTYNRDIALVNEDIHYLTWDHPMVTAAMDIVLTSELGNTSLIAIEHDEMEAGMLLLEGIYIYESASSQSLQTSRYLPATTIRTVVDEQGNCYDAKLDLELIGQCTIQVDRETAGKIVQTKAEELKQMTSLGKQQAEKLAPAILHKAHRQAAQMLSKEIDRLIMLSKVSKNVRDEEIDYFKKQLLALNNALDSANLRLDALRIIITT